MDAKDLLWFSSGFRTVEAWQDAMCAHGYRVPVHLCHGLHEAMQYLDLTFPAALTYGTRCHILKWNAARHGHSAGEGHR